MRVFLTGATGFIGSAVIPELLNAGHQVLGLARTDQGAESLRAAGVEVQRGELEDLDSLRSGAAASDAVIHAAFIHDFTDFGGFVRNSQIDKRAIETLGTALAGSHRPFVVSCGLGPYGPRPTVETADAPADSPMPRVSEQAAMPFASQGVNVVAMRLPQVHDTHKQGLVTPLIAMARAKGVSAYVGDGQNRWPAAHVLDVARLYRLALEKATPGAKYHAVGEEGVALRDIAEAIGRGLNIPVVSLTPAEAVAHFGDFLGNFVGTDLTASSALTQAQLGWHPTGPGMIADLDNMRFESDSEHAATAAAQHA